MADRVGVRALQQNASEVVKRAAAGEVVEITDRGRLVARLVPAGEGGFADLRAAGLVREADRTFRGLPSAIAPRPGHPGASEILALQREE